MCWVGLVTSLGGGQRVAYRVLVRKPEGKGLLGWRCIIKIDLKVIGLKGVHLIHLAQGQMVGLCKDDNEPLFPFTVQYFLTSGGTISFSEESLSMVQKSLFVASFVQVCDLFQKLE